MRRLPKLFLYFLAFLLILSVATLTLVDNKPVNEKDYYHVMMNRLDSLNESLKVSLPESIEVGSAIISITPDSTMALAGYGARKPKEYDAIMDSVFIRTLVIKSTSEKVAILCADLLIIHPEIVEFFNQELKKTRWIPSDIFLSATHSHSSIGQWAPGVVGGLFAGKYHKKVAKIIARRMIQSLLKAEKSVHPASLGFSSMQNPDLVLNRLVGDKGEEDAFQKNLIFATEKGDIVFSTFSAHATCLTSQSRKLSGDFPSYFHQHLKKDTGAIFSLYSAGAVASMGPETPEMNQFERVHYLGEELARRIIKPETHSDSIQIVAFRIPIPLGSPQFKVSRNLALRPYLFNYAFGNPQPYISVLLLGKNLLIGTPCDFSGELALPLYEFARQRRLNLTITSFNGDYIGYITKDDWYDLEKYETRTMNWYGPGNGRYFSEIIQKIISAIDANN